MEVGETTFSFPILCNCIILLKLPTGFLHNLSINKSSRPEKILYNTIALVFLTVHSKIKLKVISIRLLITANNLEQSKSQHTPVPQESVQNTEKKYNKTQGPKRVEPLILAKRFRFQNYRCRDL